MEKSDPDDVISQKFAGHDSDIEPVVIKRKNSPFDSIMLELKLLDKAIQNSCNYPEKKLISRISPLVKGKMFSIRTMKLKE